MDITYKKIENSYSREEKQSIWDMAVGLNKVDNLVQSDEFYKLVEDGLKHDFEYENKKDYRNFTQEEIIENIAHFTANIWQIHPFIEGNTRTTALFIEKYLKKKKLSVSKDVFKDNSQYFRDALVMANSDNEDYSYLYLFFQKALFEPDIVLEEIPPIEEDMRLKP